MSNRNQIFLRAVLVFLLIGLTVPAIFSLYYIKTRSLPISKVTATATLLLPLITGAGIQQAQSLFIRPSKPYGTNEISFAWKPMAAIMLLTIYETVVATLALTHMAPPGNLACPLDRQWGRLYSNKDDGAIRSIQDAHQCCGLHHVKEMAWPFQDQNHGADACSKMLGRQGSCFGQWRRDEQIGAGLLLLVAVMTFLIKLVVFFFYRNRGSFFRHTQNRYHEITAGDGEDESIDGTNGHTSGVRGRIEGGYRDDSEEGPDIRNDRAAAVRTPTAIAGSTDHGPTVQPSRLRHEGNEWEG